MINLKGQKINSRRRLQPVSNDYLHQWVLPSPQTPTQSIKIKQEMATSRLKLMLFLLEALLKKTHRPLPLLVPNQRQGLFHLQIQINPNLMMIILKLRLLVTKKKRSKVPRCKNLPMRLPPFSTTPPLLQSSKIRSDSSKTHSLFMWRTSIALQTLVTSLVILSLFCQGQI